MVTAFLTAHADFIFWFGVVVETVGWVWFLFDSYRCDVEMARWALFFPPFALFFVVRYPEECWKSFLVSVLGAVLLWAGEHYAPPGKGGMLPLPDTESQLSQ